MFAFQEKFDVVVPGGGLVRCHKLSRTQLRKAAELQQVARIGQVRELGTDLFKAMRQVEADPDVARAKSEYERKKADPKEQLEARYANYDEVSVALGAIESWSFEEPVTEESIRALDDETGEILHRTILDRSLRPMEQQATQEKEGKDSAPSTSS